MSTDPPWSFRVSRRWLRWELYAMFKYGGYFIARFWLKKNADKAARNLTRFVNYMPERLRRQEAYDNASEWLIKELGDSWP